MSFVPSDLHVVAVISNPVRYASRYRLHQKFEEMCRKAGVHLTVVEAAFGERRHEVTRANNGPGQGDELVNHIQVRMRDELWVKENLVNIGFAAVPESAKYLAWVDADITFERPDWAVETIHQLQHYAVVQMWRSAIDLGPNGEAMQLHQSMGYSYVNGIPNCKNKNAPSYYGAYWHSGFAWAIRRDALDTLGGLLDRAILGAGDHHMALALVGRAEESLPQGLNPNYDKMVLDWQDRATQLHHNVGYVEGSILHSWHGKKKDRKYWERWSVLKKHQYDPTLDVRPDYRGVLHLTHRGERMRHDLRMYFRQRNEDSIDND